MKFKLIIKKYVNLKTAIVAILFLTVVSFVSSIIANNILNSKVKDFVNNSDNAISTTYNYIVKELKTNGVTNYAKKLMSDYNKLFGTACNIVITDNKNKILYTLNNNYLSGKASFYVILDPDVRSDDYYYSEKLSEFGYLIDKRGKIKYEVTVNSSSLDELIKKSTGNIYAEELFKKSRYKLSNSQYHYKDFLYKDIGLKYDYLPSRGINLFAINEFNSTLYDSNGVYKFKNLLDIKNSFILTTNILFLLFWLTLPIWVFLDARKREFRAPLWGILTLIVNVVGLIIYLIVRPENMKCKNCGKQLNFKFIKCPYCGTNIKSTCSSCKQVLEDDWIVCPFCGEQRESEEGNTLREQR